MKPVRLGNGAKCPKCGSTMVRLGHKPEWKPKPSQKYYFKYYDNCPRHHHLQLYEAAKVWVNPQEEPQEPDHLTAAFKATLN